MSDAALHTAFGASFERPTTLQAFAAVLLGESPLAPSRATMRLGASAERRAAERLRRGREMPPGHLLRAYPYRTLYVLAKERAAVAKRSPGRPSGRSKSARALDGLLGLRHRQRAALALRYILGLEEAEVAYVLGVRERQAAEVIRAGVRAVVRLAGGPLDVPRSLRAAGTAMRERAGARAAGPLVAEPAPEPSRLPRAVVRRLLAPPPAEGTPGPARRAALRRLPPRPVYGVLRGRSRGGRSAHEASGEAARPTRTIRWRSLAGVAAALALVTLALLPASGRDALRRSPVPLAAVPLASTFARDAVPARPPSAVLATYRVRPGDTLWAIAARALGDPYRWPEIFRRNAGRRMADGIIFLDPDLIRPGWVLTLPGG